MVLVWVVSYTQHKCYPCDRILYRGQKTGFWVSCCLNLIWCLLYPPNPPQLPRETLWTGWKRSWVRPTPPTNAHMVTENCPTGRKPPKHVLCSFLSLFFELDHLRLDSIAVPLFTNRFWDEQAYLLKSTGVYLGQLPSAWVFLGLLGSTWVNLGLLGSTWVYLGQFGSTWVNLGQLGSTWVNLGKIGSTWVYLGLLGSTWVYLGLLGSTWV